MYETYGSENIVTHAAALAEDVAEGELPVDVAETENALIITAPVAGVNPDALSIHLNGDILTIRGAREREAVVSDEHFFSEECFWGAFSRSIILPVDVRAENAAAAFKNGMLTITIPKYIKTRHIPIVVIDEE